MKEEHQDGEISLTPCVCCTVFRQGKYSRLGGGLIIITLNLMLEIIFKAISLITLPLYGINSLIFEEKIRVVKFLIFCVMDFLIIGFAIYALVFLIRKCERFKRVFKIFIVILISSSFFEVILINMEEIFLYGYIPWTFFFDSASYPIVLACLAYPYLKCSKRVRMTLVH